MKRRRYLLAGGLLLGLLAAGYSLWTLPGESGSSRQTTSRADCRSEEKWRNILAKLPRLESGLLGTREKPFSRCRVNLFRSLQSPRPVAAPVPLRPVPPPVPKAPVVAEEEPPLLPPDFDYLGQVLVNRNRTVFLRHKGEVFIVREGDSFGPAEEFRVAAVQAERVLLTWVGSDAPIIVSFADRGSRVAVLSRPTPPPLPSLSASARLHPSISGPL